jgi:hypothetical protein
MTPGAPVMRSMSAITYYGVMFGLETARDELAAIVAEP